MYIPLRRCKVKYFTLQQCHNGDIMHYSEVQLEILEEIKFGGWAQNHHCKNFGGFNFGSLVRNHHIHVP